MSAGPAIFVSTGAFREHDIHRIVSQCLAEGITGLELSSAVSRVDPDALNDLSQLRETGRLDFLVHNYFPPPPQPFVLNLASDNVTTLRKSMDHCRRAIHLCSLLKVPFYSVHCGFCFHADPADLGKRVTSLPRIDHADAEEIFINSITELTEYGGKRNVRLAVENNVLAPFNMVNGGGDLFLGVCAEELLRIIQRIDNPNLSVLLDLAHLKVSTQSLGTDPHHQIRLLADHVQLVHLSDNDGRADTNQPLDDLSWFWNSMRFLHRLEFVVLEVNRLSLQEIINQLTLIAEKIDSHR